MKRKMFTNPILILANSKSLVGIAFAGLWQVLSSVTLKIVHAMCLELSVAHFSHIGVQ